MFLALQNSGLRHDWWPEASQCFTFLRNVREATHRGKTLYELRFGEKFNGPTIPFGAAVLHKPAETATSQNPKFGPRMKPGIFVGYFLNSGGKWSGDLLVVDED